MKKVNPNRMGLPPVESYIKKYNYKDGEGHLYIVKPWPDLERYNNCFGEQDVLVRSGC